MCQCDFDPPQVHSTRFPVTRKSRRCYECGRVIEQGEKYRYTFAVYDGEPHAYSICIGCSAGIDWLSEHCGCWLYGGVRDDLVDHFVGGHTEFNLGRLIISMKKQWTWRGGERMPIPVHA